MAPHWAPPASWSPVEPGYPTYYTPTSMLAKRPLRGEPEEHRLERRKRVKSGAACSQCRKNKTRCELPSGEETSCHRCRVLKLECSIEFPDALESGVAPMPPPQYHSQAYSHRALSPIETSNASMYSPHHTPRPRSSIPASPSAYASSMHATRPVSASRDVPPQRPPRQSAWVLPMKAVHSMMRRTDAPSSPTTAGFASDNDILDQGQIEQLIDIFDTRFAPWIGLPAQRPTDPPPFWLDNFLTLARCAVACRFLPTDEFVSVLPQLLKMVEHAVLVKTFNIAHSATLEGVEALLILAVWLPTIGNLASEVLHDATPLAVWAVKMGYALKLEKASEQAAGILNSARQAGRLNDDDKKKYRLAVYKAKIWSACCNAEWMLTSGTSDTAVAACSPYDLQVLDWRRFSGTGSLQEARDFRLGLTIRIQDSVARGCSLQLRNLPSFMGEVNEVLTLLSEVRNILLPLQFMPPLERLHTDVLMVLQYHSRLLVLCHAMAQTRAYVGGLRQDSPRPADFDRAGLGFAKIWGIEFQTAAQSVLTTFFNLFNQTASGIQPTESDGDAEEPARTVIHPLSSAPDSFFSSVLLAAWCMIVARYVMLRQYKQRSRFFVNTAEMMLSRLASALDAVALSEEHAPRKAASVVWRLRELWREATLEFAISTPSAESGADRIGDKGKRRRGSADASDLSGGDDAVFDDDAALLELMRSFGPSPSPSASGPQNRTPTAETFGSSGMWGDIPSVDIFWRNLVDKVHSSHSSYRD